MASNMTAHSLAPTNASELSTPSTSAHSEQSVQSPTPVSTPRTEELEEPQRCPVHKTSEECDANGLGHDQRDEITSRLGDSTLMYQVFPLQQL